MRIVNLTVEGFQSWRRKETIDIEGLNLVAVVGGNKTGKSSLLDAFRWCLWGTSRGGTVTDVISRGASLVRVETVVDVPVGRVRIVRTRTRSGRHEVYVSIADDAQASGWRELSEKHSGAADELIVDLIGSTEHVASLTWLVGQGGAGDFCEAAPSMRRAVLSTAFGLDRYADLAKAAEETRKEAREARDRAAWNVESLTARIAALDEDVETATGAYSAQRLAEAEEELKRCTQALQNAQDAARRSSQVEELTASVSKISATVDAAQKRVSDLEALAHRSEHRCASVQKAQDDVENAQTAVQRADKDLQAAREADQEAVVALTTQRTTLNILIERAAGLTRSTDSTCTVCRSSLSPARLAQLQDETQAAIASAEERVRQGQEKLKAAATRTAQAQTDMNVLVTQQSVAEQHLTEVKRDAAASAQAQTDLVGARTDVADLEQTLTRLREDLDTARLAPVVDEAQMGELRTACDDANRSVSVLVSARAHLESLQAQRETVSETFTQALIERDTTAQAYTVADILVHAYRPGGIPAMILSGVIDELNTEANQILSQTGTDEMGVRVSMTKTGKNSTTEALTVYATSAHGEVPYTTLSGSEKFRLALAIRLGLSRCVARRTGTPVRTIILDEGWGALDEETRRNVGGVLAGLAGTFGVITVSHVDDVKESFEHLVHVDASTGSSRAVVSPS